MFGNRFLAPKQHHAIQQMLLRQQQQSIQRIFVIANVLLLLLVFYTSYRFPHKFVRVEGEYVSKLSCDSNWLHIDAPEDSNTTCCNQALGGYTDTPCYIGMDLMPVLGSLAGAWAIPLSALVFNYGSMMLGPNVTMSRVRIYVRRGLLYAAVMALRTVVLYTVFGHMEQILGSLVMGQSNHSCWYANLRRGKQCPGGFDHSDHIVLLVSHYMAIPLFEWFALSVESTGPSLKRTLLRTWIVIISGIATYLLFFTASFFHTAAENLVGLLIAEGCVMLPLMLVTQDYFTFCKWLRLHNFVLLPEGSKRSN